MRTVNCVFCGKPATAYNGHVHRPFTDDDDTVLAGLCEECFGVVFDTFFTDEHECPYKLGWHACYGNWQPWHGIRSADDLEKE